MKLARVQILVLSAFGAVALTGTGFAGERYERSGFLQVVKECSEFTGLPGSFCTVTSTSIPGIPVGARIYYTQPLSYETVGLDTNVVLDAGGNDRAFGRCTLDTGFQGLCTFSDGTGALAGFTARVDVTTTDYVSWTWVGTYRFSELGISWPRAR